MAFDLLCDRLHLTRRLGGLLALRCCELVRLFVRMRVLMRMLWFRGPRRLCIRLLALRRRPAALTPAIALLTL